MQKCCKIKIAGEATLQLKHAKTVYATALKKQTVHASIFDNLEKKLTKHKETHENTKTVFFKTCTDNKLNREKEIQLLQTTTGGTPTREFNADGVPQISFIPPPTPSKDAQQENETPLTTEELDAMKEKIKSLLAVHQSTLQQEQKKAMEYETQLKNIATKMNDNKEQREKETAPIVTALEEAQWLLDDCETIVEELKVENQASRDRLVFWINSFIFLIFPGLVVKIFKLFDCTEILNIKYLTADLSIQCYQGEHLSYSILGYVLIAFYVFGIPIYTFYVLYKNRASLYDQDHPEFWSSRRRYGGVFSQYEEEFWYWEVVEMGKKVALTGGLIVVAKGSSAQLLVGEVICACYLLLVVRTLPYESDADDVLQSVASICLLFTMMMMFALKTDIPENPEYNRESMGIVLTLLNVIVLALACVGIGIVMYPVMKSCKKSCKKSCEKKRCRKNAKEKEKDGEEDENSKDVEEGSVENEEILKLKEQYVALLKQLENAIDVDWNGSEQVLLVNKQLDLFRSLSAGRMQVNGEGGKIMKRKERRDQKRGGSKNRRRSNSSSSNGRGGRGGSGGRRGRGGRVAQGSRSSRGKKNSSTKVTPNRNRQSSARRASSNRGRAGGKGGSRK